MAKVLLTGGSGFIASHILDILLDNGFDVVVTVRSDDKGRKILESSQAGRKGRVSYTVVRDIAEGGAFNHAVQSSPPFRYVIHTASPYFFGIKDPVKEILDPSIKGTKGLLESVKAYAPKVERVVITSSSAAILNPSSHAKVYDETIWGTTTWEEALDPIKAYRAGKIYAERAAWEFVAGKDEASRPTFDLVTIQPPLVFGPPPRHLSSLAALNTSNHRIRDILRLFSPSEGGDDKGRKSLPPTGPVFLFCDVRDAALAHVRALQVPEAGGNRFFVVGGMFSNWRIWELVREKMGGKTIRPRNGERERKMEEDDMPDDVYGFNSDKSKEVLGIEYHDLRMCIGDTVSAMIKYENLGNEGCGD